MSIFILCMIKSFMALVLFDVWHAFQFLRLIRNASTKTPKTLKKNQTKQKHKIALKNRVILFAQPCDLHFCIQKSASNAYKNTSLSVFKYFI